MAAYAGAAVAKNATAAAATPDLLKRIKSAGDPRVPLRDDTPRGADAQALDLGALGDPDRGRAGPRRPHPQDRDAAGVRLRRHLLAARAA